MKKIIFFILMTGVTILAFSQTNYQGTIYVTGGIPEFEFNLNMEAFCSKDSIQNAGKMIAVDIASMVCEELKKTSLTNCSFLKGESALNVMPRPHKNPMWNARLISPSNVIIFGRNMKVACDVGCSVGTSTLYLGFEETAPVNKSIFPEGTDYALVIWPCIWNVDLGGGDSPLSGFKTGFIKLVYGFYNAKTGEFLFADQIWRSVLKIKSDPYNQLLGGVTLKLKDDFLKKINTKGSK